MGGLFSRPKAAEVLPAQVGVTNAQAQAQSNAESADRARARLTLANRPRTSLLNEDLEASLLS